MVFVVFVGIWYLLAEVILPKQKRFLLPPPHRVISDGFLVWHDGNRGLKPILDSLALTAGSRSSAWSSPSSSAWDWPRR